MSIRKLSNQQISFRMINAIRNISCMRSSYVYKRKYTMHRIMCTVTVYNSRGLQREGRQRRHDQSYFRLRETRNFGVRAKVRVVRARGGTNGMVFTNANKHSYQLQNDSRPAGAQSAYRLCRTILVTATSYDAFPSASSTSTVLNF